MKSLKVDLENCYGIRKLSGCFDFSNCRVHQIYAPNGSMKTSFTKTFKDIVESKETVDQIYKSRLSKRNVTDELGNQITGEKILIIQNYDEFFETEKTSTLLVDNTLRKEYERINLEIEKSKSNFLNTIKKQSGSKRNLEEEISIAFAKKTNDFYNALKLIKNDVLNIDEAPFSFIQYDIIFDDKVREFLRNEDVRRELESYIKKYDQLLDASTFFRKGTFDYYNASTIAENLEKNGFFKARHSVNLNADEKIEINSQQQLEEIIQKEKDQISNDKELKKIYENIDKLIIKNANTRELKAFLQENEVILPMLYDLEKFKSMIFLSYFRENRNLFSDLIKKIEGSEKRITEIERAAGSQKTQWEKVIEEFNNRFFVPFKLIPKNRIPVIVGEETVLSLGYEFDGFGEDNPIEVEKGELLETLSQGEKKAFYLLNIIFEIEARKQDKQETIFIIDDVADSFDYQNKYAIIQYLQDIAAESYFFQIILTHNFDFFRTVTSRLCIYSNCHMINKNLEEITLIPAIGIRNIFVNDWKRNFFTSKKKRISSIPFIRNLIEYLRGESDPDFIKLTSLMHWKTDTTQITQNDLDLIFNRLFNTDNFSTEGDQILFESLKEEADDCLESCISTNFENKIVLSIATRIFAEKYMAEMINDQLFLDGLTSLQTPKLLEKFSESNIEKVDQINVIKRVLLMTPENLHLNSFMYEPIIDMSDTHLKRLYIDVLNLGS